MNPDQPKPRPHERDPTGASASPLTLSLDMEEYLGQLEDWDINEEQKREFIATLWSLLVTCAEIGLQIHPVQRAQKPCGKPEEIRSSAALSAPDGLYSSLSKQFEKQEKSDAQCAAERRESPS